MVKSASSADSAAPQIGKQVTKMNNKGTKSLELESEGRDLRKNQLCTLLMLKSSNDTINITH